MSWVRLNIGAIIVLLLGTVFSCSNRGEKLKVTEGVAARVYDKKIMERTVDDRFDKLPQNQKDQYKGSEGRARFVDILIDEEMLYLEAKRKNLQNDKDIKKQIELAEKTVLIGAYYEKFVKPKIKVTDLEIEEYYNEHINQYTKEGVIKAQHIFSEDSMKCVEWIKRLKAGEKFDKIAKMESEDETTAPTNGDLGYFNLNGFIKFIGYSDRFSDQIKDLEAGDISGVVSHEKGYSVVKINKKQPQMITPLSEERLEIEELLKTKKAHEEMTEELDRLRKEMKPENLVREEYMETIRTPEEMWEVAQAEDASYTRIQYYRNLVNTYPDDKYAPQALFMIGFVYAEELNDLPFAHRTFEELIRRYPDAEVVESAKWMMENMGKAHPKFESFEDMKEQMKENE